MFPPAAGDSKIFKEYEPPTIVLRRLTWGGIFFLSGVTDMTHVTFDEQFPVIIKRLSDTLSDGGGSWEKVVRASFFLHHEESLDKLRECFGRSGQRTDCEPRLHARRYAAGQAPGDRDHRKAAVAWCTGAATRHNVNPRNARPWRRAHASANNASLPGNAWARRARATDVEARSRIARLFPTLRIPPNGGRQCVGST